MKVKMFGFSLEEGDGIAMDDFIAHLSNVSSDDHEYDFSGRQRLFLFEDSDDDAFQAGLFVTIKDHKKFCKLLREQGVVTIRVDELGDDESLMEFNFFILNKNNATGLYLYYHASCSLGQFGAFLRDRWKELKAPRIDERCQQLLDEGRHRSERQARKTAEREFKKNVVLAPYFRPEDFRALLEEFERIQWIEYPVETADIGINGFAPLRRRVSKAKQRLVFSRNTPVQTLARELSTFRNRAGLVKGRVHGEDEEGVQYSIKIEGNLSSFGEADFDQLAEEMNIDLPDFADSSIVTRLLEVARENAAMFIDVDA